MSFHLLICEHVYRQHFEGLTKLKESGLFKMGGVFSSSSSSSSSLLPSLSLFITIMVSVRTRFIHSDG